MYSSRKHAAQSALDWFRAIITLAGITTRTTGWPRREDCVTTSFRPFWHLFVEGRIRTILGMVLIWMSNADTEYPGIVPARLSEFFCNQWYRTGASNGAWEWGGGGRKTCMNFVYPFETKLCKINWRNRSTWQRISLWLPSSPGEIHRELFACLRERNIRGRGRSCIEWERSDQYWGASLNGSLRLYIIIPTN